MLSTAPHESLDETIATLADGDAMQALAAVLARLLRVAETPLLELLGNGSDDPSCVICRAAGLRIDAYSAVLRMRRRARLGFDQNPAGSLRAFRRLPFDSAKPLLGRLLATVKFSVGV